MTASATTASLPQRAMMPVLIALSVTHLLNDMIQSLIPAIIRSSRNPTSSISARSA